MTIREILERHRPGLIDSLGNAASMDSLEQSLVRFVEDEIKKPMIQTAETGYAQAYAIIQKLQRPPSMSLRQTLSVVFVELKDTEFEGWKKWNSLELGEFLRNGTLTLRLQAMIEMASQVVDESARDARTQMLAQKGRDERSNVPMRFKYAEWIAIHTGQYYKALIRSNNQKEKDLWEGHAEGLVQLFLEDNLLVDAANTQESRVLGAYDVEVGESIANPVHSLCQSIAEKEGKTFHEIFEEFLRDSMPNLVQRAQEAGIS